MFDRSPEEESERESYYYTLSVSIIISSALSHSRGYSRRLLLLLARYSANTEGSLTEDRRIIPLLPPFRQLIPTKFNIESRDANSHGKHAEILNRARTFCAEVRCKVIAHVSPNLSRYRLRRVFATYTKSSERVMPRHYTHG